MTRPKREDSFKRINITFSEDLHAQVLKNLPIEGMRDFSSFIELAARRLLESTRKTQKR
jgi:metal-responsive CopG/Arc/MetJ family transcriptional regulator